MRTLHIHRMVIRQATREDISRLSQLIERSVRVLQRDDYTSDEIDGALATLYGVDTRLIDDGTYFVAEVEGAIVACGGWSKRKTLYGGDVWSQREDDILDATTGAAKIRAFFVDPDFSRHGFGSLLLEACESAARAAGFCRFEMGATITGVRLYERCGYVAVDRVRVPLPGAAALTLIRMVKEAES